MNKLLDYQYIGRLGTRRGDEKGSFKLHRVQLAVEAYRFLLSQKRSVGLGLARLLIDRDDPEEMGVGVTTTVLQPSRYPS